MTFLLILVFAGIILFEAPDLIRKKHWRELTVFSLFLSTAFMMTLLQAIGVKLPNPLKGFQYLISEVLHLSYK